MSKPNKSLYIFDLDGTLVNAYIAIQKSLNFTLKELDYKGVSLRRVKKSVGWGLRLFIEGFFKPQDIDKALRIYRKHHKQSLKKYATLMPFAKKILKSLKSKKKYVAVASNRPTRFTNIILKKLDIRKYIDYVLCADKLRKIKPAPEILKRILRRFKKSRQETVYIGDMVIDLEASRNAHLDSVFIKGGSNTIKEIKRFKEAKVISSLNQILDIYE